MLVVNALGIIAPHLGWMIQGKILLRISLFLFVVFYFVCIFSPCLLRDPCYLMSYKIFRSSILGMCQELLSTT